MAKGRIQNQDIKSAAELTAQGAGPSSLPNDDKIWIKSRDLNKTLAQSVLDGDLIRSIALINLIDTSSTIQPTNDPATIDGKTVVDGDLVLFTSLTDGGLNNRVYKASISGGSITWTLQKLGKDETGAPSIGDFIYTTEGDTINTLFVFDSTEWFVFAGGAGGVVKSTLLDPVSDSLPSGSSATIDGQTLQNDDLVLFTNLSSGNNRIYKASGVGSSITWEAQPVFNGEIDPTDGDLVIIQTGDAFSEQLATFNGTNFLVNDTIRMFDGVSADFFELSSIKTTTLLDNTTDSVFEVSVANNENFIVDYSIARGSNKETGTIIITSDGINADTAKAFVSIGDVGVSFDADVDSGNLRLRSTTTNTGNDATMKYSVKRWSNAAGGPSGIPNYSTTTSGTSPAAGTTSEIQYRGNDGNLAADVDLLWDATEDSISMNGKKISKLSDPITINDNQGSPDTLFTVDASTYKFMVVEYSIQRGVQYRTGRILISTDGSSTVGFSDDFVETGSVGVTLSASVSSGTLSVQYVSTSTGVGGEFKYSIRKW